MRYTDEYVEDLLYEIDELKEKVADLEMELEEYKAEVFERNKVVCYTEEKTGKTGVGMRLKNGDIIDLDTGEQLYYFDCEMEEPKAAFDIKEFIKKTA